MAVVELPDGRQIDFPDGTAPAEMERAVRAFIQQETSNRPAGERAARMVGNFGAGFNRSLAQTVGALPDLVSSGLRAVGVPTPEPGFYTGQVQRGINALVGEPPTPQTTGERFAHGAGQGVGDAMAVLAPATAVAQGARAGSTAQRVGATLAGAPGLQVAAGAAGGGVGEATDSPLLGLATSIAIPAVAATAGRAVTPVRPDANPARAALVAAAGREGIPLSPAQATGSRSLANLEAAFATLPLTSGTEQAARNAQQEAFNAAALRRGGVTAPRATPDVLREAVTTTGGTIGEVAGRNTAQFQGRPANRLAELANEVERYAPSDTARIVNNYIDDLVSKVSSGRDQGDVMLGRAVRELDTTLGRRIRETNDGDLGRYLGRLQNILRDALESNAAPGDAEAIREARRQYANLMVLNRAAGTAGAAGAQGDITPSGLRSALAQGDREGYALGRGDLNELARVGDAVIRPTIPNSGTPERTMMINMLTGGGAYGTALAGGVDPGTAAALAGSALLPRFVQAFYNSPAGRAYMSNGLLQDFQPMAAVPGLLAGQGRGLLETTAGRR